MTQGSFSLTVSSDVANLKTIIDFVTEAAQKAGLDDQDTFAVQLAVDEACTNVMEHAYGDEQGDIHLTCYVKPGECIITIRDHGCSFDPQAVPPPDLDGDLENRRVGGLGLYFMREFVDEILFSFDPEEGNQVVMIKRAKRDDKAKGKERFSLVMAHGRLDANTAPDLENQLKALLDQGNVRIIVDMATVTYISSSGLKVLLTALRQADRQRGQVVLCNLQPKVTTIFELSGFDQVFPIGQNMDVAIRLLGQT